MMAGAIDEAISAADDLEMDQSCEAIAAAQLCACCAGHLAERLPDRVHGRVQDNPHGPHADEIVLMTKAVSRVREDSESRDYWEKAGDSAPSSESPQVPMICRDSLRSGIFVVDIQCGSPKRSKSVSGLGGSRALAQA
ncbi:MAG TPA: DUF4259 domain-containing protein [Solirubrobacteraceae bacterium]|nr:DUF4259 domain-containing protein [Solirubrobacteraceae bacterium]